MNSEEARHAALPPIQTGQTRGKNRSMVKPRFSDYVVYVDESGDHSLSRIDGNFPVFVLALCVFDKKHYTEKVTPAVDRFKFDHFGHNSVVLHEHDIRKQRGAFAFLSHHPRRIEFIAQLTAIMESSEFALISCLVDKARLSRDEDIASNPYHIALGICIELLDAFLSEKRQDHRQTHVVVECRGKKEDAELALAFKRICDGDNRRQRALPFDIVFADKKTNLTGLQLADLVARPIGLRHLRPQQQNRAYELLQRKFFREAACSGRGTGRENAGLRIYPPQKAKSPDEFIEAATPTGNPQSTCSQV